MIHNTLKGFITFLFLFTAVVLHGATLTVDKSHSEVGFSIKHLMISTVNGKFMDYSGDIEFDTQSKKFSKFNATVSANSIDTGIEKRDNHLRSEDFFHVEKYPNITFTMDSYKANGDEGILKGFITIHGVTKPLELEVEYHGTVKDPWGKIRAGFTLEGELNRKDFGLTWNKALEAGGVVVGDKVKLQIELQTFVK
jgi:polyisoprenoid-binding protein YceI